MIAFRKHNSHHLEVRERYHDVTGYHSYHLVAKVLLIQLPRKQGQSYSVLYMLGQHPLLHGPFP